ncbi:MAG: hypothetical protein ACP5G1_02845 [Nanopusillaceae archaeon]
MKLNLIVLPKKGFHEDDLFNFLDILDGRTYVATQNKDIAIGKYKSKVVPDFDVEDIFLLQTADYDRIIFIADEGFKYFNNNEIYGLFVRFLNSYKTVILSSLAQIAFARAGLLTGRTIVYNNDDYPEYINELREYGITINTVEDYYVDRNLITVKGRDSIYELGKKLEKIENNIKEYLL